MQGRHLRHFWKQIRPLTFQLAPCHRQPHSHSIVYTPLHGLQAPGMARSSRPFKTDLRAHPASSISTGVAFVKWLSASQEPRKTLPSGKALKWGEPEALRAKMRFKVLLKITSIFGLGFWGGGVWSFGFFFCFLEVTARFASCFL